MKKFSFVVLLFSLFFGGCVIRVSDSNNPKEEITKKEDTLKETKSEHDIEGSLTTLDYLGCEVFEEEYYGKMIAFYFDFGNKSEENQAFYTTYTVKAFQNGIEMEKSYFSENESYENSVKDIQPDNTVKVAVVYEYKDNENPINLEVYPWISFEERKLFEIEIKPE